MDHPCSTNSESTLRKQTRLSPYHPTIFILFIFLLHLLRAQNVPCNQVTAIAMISLGIRSITASWIPATVLKRPSSTAHCGRVVSSYWAEVQVALWDVKLTVSCAVSRTDSNLPVVTYMQFRPQGLLHANVPKVVKHPENDAYHHICVS